MTDCALQMALTGSVCAAELNVNHFTLLSGSREQCVCRNFTFPTSKCRSKLGGTVGAASFCYSLSFPSSAVALHLVLDASVCASSPSFSRDLCRVIVWQGHRSPCNLQRFSSRRPSVYTDCLNSTRMNHKLRFAKAYANAISNTQSKHSQLPAYHNLKRQHEHPIQTQTSRANTQSFQLQSPTQTSDQTLNRTSIRSSDQALTQLWHSVNKSVNDANIYSAIHSNTHPISPFAPLGGVGSKRVRAECWIEGCVGWVLIACGFE